MLLAVLAVGGLGLAWVYLQGSSRVGGRGGPAAVPGDATGEMSEAERVEYVKQNVRVEDLKVGPDTKPDGPEPVPGLLRISGTLVNAGPKVVKSVHLAVYPKDAAGKVLGSHMEDPLVKTGPLAPGESRDFWFHIPEKRDFAGDFGHSLR